MASLFSLVLLVALPMQSQTNTSQTSPTSEIYCNERFDFCSQFPSETFPTQLDFRKGDGLLLRTENDLATVIIAAYHDFSGDNAEAIFQNEVKKQTTDGQRTVLISSLFGEDFYECFFLIGHRSFYHKAYLSHGKLIRLSIETTINQPKLMQELRENVSLYFPGREEGFGWTERE